MSLLNPLEAEFDERSFEQFARALAAVSDLVLTGVLLFVSVFRVQVSAFSLLRHARPCWWPREPGWGQNQSFNPIKRPQRH